MSYDIYTGLLKAFPLRKKGNAQINFSMITIMPSWKN